MKIQKSAVPFTLAISALLVGFGVPAGLVSAQGPDRAAQAQERREAAEQIRTERTQDVEAKKAEILEKVEAKRAEVKEKLDQKRLEVCEKRAEKINKIVARSVEQSERHLAVFTKIADRTVAFYEEKKLTAENFDQLVAAVEEKEAAASGAIEAAQEVTFKCEDQDAGNVGAVVKDLMKSQHAALHEHRLAIKDLIVAVKQAAKTAEAEESTDAEGAGSEATEQETTTTNETTQE